MPSVRPQIVAVLIFLAVLSLSVGRLAAQDAEADKAKKPPKESALKGQSKELDGAQFLTPDPIEAPPMDPMMMGMQKANQPPKPIPGPVLLSATYYFGNADKETVPVLLLHGQGGNRRDFTPLTDALVNAGFGVMAVDLRGHGKSNKRYEITPPQITMQTTTKQRNNNKGGGKAKVVTEPVMTAPASRKLVDYKDKDEEIMPKDFIDSAKYDLPLLRNTMLKIHDNGLANMNRLVIIGVDRGAALAAFQTMQDWAEKDSPRLTKTLIMISPVDLDVNVDTARLFHDNKWMGNGLGALFVIPQGNPSSQMLAEKIRTELIGKNAEDETVTSRFQIFSYVPEKKVKTDKGETLAPRTWTETFADKEAGVTQKIIDFINQRNAAFKEKEARWSKIK